VADELAATIAEQKASKKNMIIPSTFVPTSNEALKGCKCTNTAPKATTNDVMERTSILVLFRFCPLVNVSMLRSSIDEINMTMIHKRHAIQSLIRGKPAIVKDIVYNGYVLYLR